VNTERESGGRLLMERSFQPNIFEKAHPEAKPIPMKKNRNTT
jgi:hypothetical protein